MKSILVVGCSLSDYCGFGKIIGNHNDARCWYNILADRLKAKITNLSYGGLSNKEILHRANHALIQHTTDIIILQTTSIKRQWFWRDNSEKFCIFAGGHAINTENSHEQAAILEIGTNLFDSKKEVERDIVSLLLLQNLCEQKGTQLVIVDGMGFIRTSSFWFNIEYGMLNQQALLKTNAPWHTMAIDKAEDGMHPGHLSQIMYADQLSSHLRSSM